MLVLSSEVMANCLHFLAVLEMSFKIRCAKTGERLYNILAASVSHLVLWQLPVERMPLPIQIGFCFNLALFY